MPPPRGAQPPSPPAPPAQPPPACPHRRCRPRRGCHHPARRRRHPRRSRRCQTPPSQQQPWPPSSSSSACASRARRAPPPTPPSASPCWRAAGQAAGTPSRARPRCRKTPAPSRTCRVFCAPQRSMRQRLTPHTPTLTQMRTWQAPGAAGWGISRPSGGRAAGTHASASRLLPRRAAAWQPRGRVRAAWRTRSASKSGPTSAVSASSEARAAAGSALLILRTEVRSAHAVGALSQRARTPGRGA